MSTLRPFGPKVVATAFERVSTPLRIAARASTPNFRSFNDVSHHSDGEYWWLKSLPYEHIAVAEGLDLQLPLVEVLIMMLSWRGKVGLKSVLWMPEIAALHLP